MPTQVTKSSARGHCMLPRHVGKWLVATVWWAANSCSSKGPEWQAKPTQDAKHSSWEETPGRIPRRFLERWELTQYGDCDYKPLGRVAWAKMATDKDLWDVSATVPPRHEVQIQCFLGSSDCLCLLVLSGPPTLCRKWIEKAHITFFHFFCWWVFGNPFFRLLGARVHPRAPQGAQKRSKWYQK